MGCSAARIDLQAENSEDAETVVTLQEQLSQALRQYSAREREYGEAMEVAERELEEARRAAAEAEQKEERAEEALEEARKAMEEAERKEERASKVLEDARRTVLDAEERAGGTGGRGEQGVGKVGSRESGIAGGCSEIGGGECADYE